MVGSQDCRVECRGAFLGVLLAALVGALACISMTSQRADAAPEPAPIPTRWELTLEPGPLRVMTVETPEGSKPFYYFTYKVTNYSGEDRLFTPTFEMFTDDGTLVPSGRGVPHDVTEYILRRLRNPLLLDEIQMQDNLLQGRENAREGLVVWPVRNLSVDEIKIFANGFSGETKTVFRADTGEAITLRKTMMLVHSVAGEVNTGTSRPIPRLENASRWIMR